MEKSALEILTRPRKTPTHAISMGVLMGIKLWSISQHQTLPSTPASEEERGTWTEGGRAQLFLFASQSHQHHLSECLQPGSTSWQQLSYTSSAHRPGPSSDACPPAPWVLPPRFYYWMILNSSLGVPSLREGHCFPHLLSLCYLIAFSDLLGFWCAVSNSLYKIISV
jgi:hypothetical protein